MLWPKSLPLRVVVGPVGILGDRRADLRRLVGLRPRVERVEALADAPAVVAAVGDDVDDLVLVLADVAGPERPALAVEAELPDVPQADAIDLGRPVGEQSSGRGAGGCPWGCRRACRPRGGRRRSGGSSRTSRRGSARSSAGRRRRRSRRGRCRGSRRARRRCSRRCGSRTGPWPRPRSAPRSRGRPCAGRPSRRGTARRPSGGRRRCSTSSRRRTRRSPCTSGGTPGRAGPPRCRG